MNQETPEDRTILATLEAPDGGLGAREGGPSAHADETEETLARLYTEVLGLIPYELDPVVPRPAVKERLMAIAAGDETQEVRREAAAPAAAPRPRAPRPAVVPPPLRRSRWPLALAASFALAFAGLSAVLAYRVFEQRDEIELLARQRDQAGEQAERAASQAEQAQAELRGLRESFLLVTGPAVEVMPLRPMDEQLDAKGNLFVAADHQHWYLSIHDLEPPGPGQAYQVWFVTPEGPVSGGMLEVRPGEPAELASPTMPADTQGALITLEAAGGASQPTGPRVLAGGAYQVS